MKMKPTRSFADHVIDVSIETGIDPSRLVMKERGSAAEAAARHELMLRLHEDHRSKSEVGRLLNRWQSGANRGIEKARWARERKARLEALTRKASAQIKGGTSAVHEGRRNVPLPSHRDAARA